MSDYIKREALFKTVEDYASTHPVMNDNELFALFCSIPTADVRPVVRGKWIDVTEQIYINGIPIVSCYHCNQCGETKWDTWTKFCPHCGAEMDGVE